MNLFFDLDGTLIDPFEGITASIAAALDSVGMTPPPRPEMARLIGPPLLDSFTALGVANPQAALAAYRAHYTGGAMYDCRLYPGALDCLAALRDAGHRLFLMTSKPHAYARKITRHMGIAEFMSAEFGPELDGTHNDKSALLAHALGVLDADPADSCMIGDRVYDVAAGRNNGMPALAVSWGYGAPTEWDGATAVVDEMAQLPGAIAALGAG